MYGLESHLTGIHRVIEDFKPAGIVIDPISNLISVGDITEVKAMLVRLIDFLKINEITTLCTDLTYGGIAIEQTEAGISSLMDTWILLRSTESDGERNRTLYIAKSRGMDHSGQVREFRLTNKGVELIDVYIGSGGVLTGAARAAREAQEKAERVARPQEVERKQRDLARKKTLLQAQLAALQAQFESEEEELQKIIDQELAREKALSNNRKEMSRMRKADAR